MERLKQIIKNDEFYYDTVNILTDLIMNNVKTEKSYTIDSIQIILYRLTNTFLLYEECEKIYDSILIRKGLRA